ncbi:hypothetical protein Dsin_027433 [Dipteronia sinensis]|uniref:Xylanase inhibitor N-terminal domain-containing protein n=1 Tax=Dipteronia sinensis TaxID=43782 RepID=A0AAE0DUK9_9ROSI|nr:hypothetical protein Dsin_027433 [Dipteronia sinensis]
MAKLSCFSIAFFFLPALVFAIEVSHVTALEASAAKYRPNVLRRAITGARRHHIKSHACFSATNVAKNACVFLLALMDTKKSAHAITTGRPKKANLSVHEHSKQHIKCTTSYPDFQTSKTSFPDNSAKTTSQDTILSSKFHDHRHLFHARMQRDVKRVAALTRRRISTAKSYEVTDLEADVVSSFDLGVRESIISNLLDNRCCHTDKHRYETVIRNMTIGCGHKNQGTFSMADMLLGVGCGSISFVNQLSPQTGGAFSYCLASWDSRSPGWLAFGGGAFPAD